MVLHAALVFALAQPPVGESALSQFPDAHTVNSAVAWQWERVELAKRLTVLFPSEPEQREKLKCELAKLRAWRLLEVVRDGVVRDIDPRRNLSEFVNPEQAAEKLFLLLGADDFACGRMPGGR